MRIERNEESLFGVCIVSEMLWLLVILYKREYEWGNKMGFLIKKKEYI